MFKELSEGTIIFLVAQAGASLVFLIRTYMLMVLKLKELEMRIATVEGQDKAILAKLDTIQSDINEIKIDLQNKVDRH